MEQAKRISELSQIMRENGIKALEIKNHDEDIKIELFSSEAKSEGTTLTIEDYEIISAPLMGLGYVNHPDDSIPYVSVGDKIKKGSVLCVIEAMKVMNEIVADNDCQIYEVCFENGKIVEFWQELFKIKRIDASDDL